MRSMRAAALLLVCTACTSASPTAPSETVAPAPRTAEVEPTSDVQDRRAVEPPVAAAVPEEEQPNPVAVRINEKYNAKSDAQGWAKRFERKGREVHDRQAEVLKALQIEPGSSVADVGVGSGLYTLALANAVGKDGTVFAVDVQDYFLEHVQKKAEKAGTQNVAFVKAEQRSANLDPGSVELVFMCDVFHHVEYPRTYLASLFAAIEPGGRLAVIDFIAEEGKSEDWVLEHVRASPAEFQAEFEAAGFVFERAPDVLEENFFHIYRKPE